MTQATNYDFLFNDKMTVFYADIVETGTVIKVRINENVTQTVTEYGLLFMPDLDITVDTLGNWWVCFNDDTGETIRYCSQDGGNDWDLWEPPSEE